MENNFYVAYILKANQMISNEQLSYSFCLQMVFEKATLSAVCASDIYFE